MIDLYVVLFLKLILILNYQLETYIIDVRSNDQFPQLKGIGDLARKIVQTRKYILYPLVHFLVILDLILSIATTTFEITFFAINIVKKSVTKSNGRSMDE